MLLDDTINGEVYCNYSTKDGIYSLVAADLLRTSVYIGSLYVHYKSIQWSVNQDSFTKTFIRGIGWFAGATAGVLAGEAVINQMLNAKYENPCQYNATRFVLPLQFTACTTAGMIASGLVDNCITYLYQKCQKSSSSNTEKDILESVDDYDIDDNTNGNHKDAIFDINLQEQKVTINPSSPMSSSGNTQNPSSTSKFMI